MIPRSIYRSAIGTLVCAMLVCASCTKPRTPVQATTQPSASRSGYVDLAPGAELSVLNAYFKEAATHILENYAGTQTARFRVEARRGLRLLSLESLLPHILKDQPRASDLVVSSMRRFRNYRYYYAVVFAKAGRGSAGSAVLLGANSDSEMEKLGDQLKADPDSVCGLGTRHCTVFPKNCTVSLEVSVIVNGAARVLQWGTRLGSVAPAGKNIRLTRSVNGKDVATELDATKPATQAMALAPGDRITWE